jgi:hypothetical protein
MKHLIALAILVMASSSAMAMFAMHTGKMEYVYTVSGKSAIKCEYTTGAGTFWQLFMQGYCPSSVEVE